MALTPSQSDDAFSVSALADLSHYSETCCAAIMRPATRDFWGVWGLPLYNDYEHVAM